MESEEEEEEKENITGSKDVGRRRYHSEHDRNGEKPQNFSVGWLVKNHQILLDQQKRVVPGNNEQL